MSGSRFAPFTGVLFVVLWVAATLVSRSPDGAEGAASAAAYYSDSSNRVMMVVGTYMFVAAALVFLCFLVSLRGRLQAAEGGDAPLTTLAFASGAVSVALMLAGILALAAVPAGVALGGVDAPTDGNITLFTQQIGFAMILVGAMIPAALSIFTTSVITRRTGALPGWTAWLGFLAAIALLFAAVWIPQIALLIWVIAIGIALRKPAPTSAARTA
jgi:hypothetical protein